jgi:hypothetical protein
VVKVNRFGEPSTRGRNTTAAAQIRAAAGRGFRAAHFEKNDGTAYDYWYVEGKTIYPG